MLDTKTISSFSTGVYLEWAVSGNVMIKVTNLAGPNAVLSGLFFDRPTDPAVAAYLIKTDTTTEGNWIGTYGTQGYDIIGNAASLPSYATVTPSGQSSYTLGRHHDRPAGPPGSPAAPAASPPAGTRPPASRWT